METDFQFQLQESAIRYIFGGVSGDNYGEHYGYGVLKSYDAGETWNIEYEYPMCASSHMSSIGFINDSTGFLIDFDDNYENGTIFKMTDGTNYNYISHLLNTYGMNKAYSKIEFFNENIAYFLSGNTVLKTLDGGVYVDAVDDIEKQNVRVYPNPTTDKIVIQSDFPVVFSTTIYDITGTVMMRSEEKSISMKDLAKGLYLVKVNFKDNRTITRKVIKE